MVLATASSLFLFHCVGDSSTPSTGGDDAGGVDSSHPGTDGGSSGGGDSGGGGGTDAGKGSNDSGVDAGVDAGPTLKQAFITSAQFDGTLGGNGGGVAAGDARCMEAAQGHFPGRKFHAWLATETTDAKDNIKGTGPWYVGNTKIGDLALFQSGTALLTDWLTETGAPPGASKTAWTGSNKFGAATNNGTTCNNWTSNSSMDNGEIGIADGAGGTWTDTSQVSCDSNLRRLYCLEE